MSDVVLVRYWAAAKAAAGRPEEELPHRPTLAALLAAITERYGAGSQLDVVLGRCSYLVDEVSPGRRPPSEIALAPGAVVDVLPPFAGGSGTAAAPARLTLT
ncbi:MAG TPA: MoaD/ThiS family protein [Candidatus Nanopelagicales bacterium]|nr:MoaD/ThiS family protein [Candidatus Nanopelagicales bacterium]